MVNVPLVSMERTVGHMEFTNVKLLSWCSKESFLYISIPSLQLDENQIHSTLPAFHVSFKKKAISLNFIVLIFEAKVWIECTNIELKIYKNELNL